jgi:D-inositol-3-phosphate glycosyltransferase
VRFSIIGPAYPLRGGIAHHVYYLSKELAERSHQVQVISHSQLYPKLLFPGKTEIDSSTLRLDPKASALLSALSPLSWRRAAKAVEGFMPDLALFEWWHPFFGPAVGTMARMLTTAGNSLAIECHNVFPHERSIFDLALTDYAFAPVRKFITHSTTDDDLLLSHFPSKESFVAPLPPPDFIPSETGSKRGGRTMLFFGFVRSYKGLDVLLSALPKVLAKVKCRLVIAGEFYEPVQLYMSKIHSLGLDEAVELHDRYIPNEEIRSLFDRADVLIMPYRSATQSGIVRMAQRQCLPIIASKAGGLAEAIRENENGLLCPPGDPDSLAAEIVRYFSQNLGPVLADKMRKAAVDRSPSKLCLLLEQLAKSAGPE